MLRNVILSTLLASLTSACASVGPTYNKPQSDVAPVFATQPAAFTAEPVVEEGWWVRFADSTLTHLVDSALRSNLDVRQAVSRVEAARAIRSEARLGYAPTGAAAASLEHTALAGARTRSAAAGLDVAWEIDLFGRVRSLNRAAEAQAGLVDALLSQTRVVVASDVAQTYFLLRAAEARATLLAGYRDDQRQLVDIIETRVTEGMDDDADLARARTVLAEDDGAIAREQQNIRMLRNALAVLIRATPGHWQLPAHVEPPAEPKLESIAIGDPSSLLQRRPDVRAAERALAAETAEIGIATAGLFPQLTLGGFFGFVAGSFGDLGTAATEAWSVGPSLRWPVLDLGRIRAQIRREKAQASGALAAYEHTVLRALEDAENAFGEFATAHELLRATDIQVRSARTAVESIQARYDEGVGSYFEFLDARRSSVRAELARIDSVAGHRVATVDVFRALGSEPTLR